MILSHWKLHLAGLWKLYTCHFLRELTHCSLQKHKLISGCHKLFVCKTFLVDNVIYWFSKLCCSIWSLDVSTVLWRSIFLVTDMAIIDWVVDGFCYWSCVNWLCIKSIFDLTLLVMRMLMENSCLNHFGCYFYCIWIFLPIKMIWAIYQRYVLLHLDVIQNLPLIFHLSSHVVWYNLFSFP